MPALGRRETGGERERRELFWASGSVLRRIDVGGEAHHVLEIRGERGKTYNKQTLMRVQSQLDRGVTRG